jgi:hypothetical protein
MFLIAKLNPVETESAKPAECRRLASSQPRVPTSTDRAPPPLHHGGLLHEVIVIVQHVYSRQDMFVPPLLLH